MTDHDCPHAVTLRNLLDACDRGRPLTDITDRLRVEVGRLAGEGTTQPDPGEIPFEARRAMQVALWERCIRSGGNEWTTWTDAITLAEEAAAGLREAGWIIVRASGEGTAPPPADDGWIEVTPDAMARACDRAHASPNAAEVGHREGFCLACAELRVAMSGEWGTAPQVPAEVLWEGETGYFAVDDFTDSHVDHLTLGVPPGTRVRVVAADGAPEQTHDPCEPHD